MTQQLDSAALSGLPAGQSLTPGTLGNLNIQLAEAGTQQLVSQSLYHLKDFPNPELVSEAVSTGATQDVATALSDPTLGQYMTATPGSNAAIPKGPDNGPGLPGENMDSFNWNQYWGGDNAKQISDNPGFKALGVMPQMNIAWMNGVMEHSDPKTTQKWQQWLIDHGTLDKGHGAAGTWDNASRQALSNYMIMLAAPDALWSKNAQRQAQANAFLSRLGVDPATLATQVGRDPAMQRSIVLGWMQTQDPQHQGDALHEFANNYGNQHLTAAEQKIASGGSLWDHITSTAAALNSMNPLNAETGPGAQLVSAIPGWIGDTEKKNIALYSRMDPRTAQGDKIAQQIKQEGFTPQEQAALAPALAQVQNSQGFLPFEWIDQKTSAILLTTIYSLGGGNHPGTNFANPFDAFNPNSDLGKRISAHQNNLAGAILGDDFAKQHQSIATLTAGIANTIDDPLTYLGGVGMRAPALVGDLGKAVRGKEIIDAATGLGVRASMGTAAKGALDRFLDPRSEMERVMAHGIYAQRASPSTIAKALRITDDTLKHPDAAALIQPALDRIKNAQSVDEVRNELHSTFGHLIHTPAFVLNKRDAMEAFSQATVKSKGEGHVLSLRTMGAFRDTGLPLDISRPHASMRTLEQLAKIVGVPDSDITKHMDEWLTTDQADRMDWINGTYIDLLDEAVQKNFPGKDLQYIVAKANDLKKGRSFVMHPSVAQELGPNTRISEVSYQPAQRGETKIDPATGKPFEPGAEMSTAKRKFPDATQRWITQHQDAVNVLEDGYKEAVDTYVRREINRDPAASVQELIARFDSTATGAALKAEKDTKVARIAAKVNELAPLGTDRAMPASEGQLQQMAMLPFTPYEAFVALNDGVLKNWEEIGSHLRLDAFYSIWKGLALARPSTAMRVMIGDDTSRFLVEMATRGHPLSAIRTFLQASTMGAYAGFAGAAHGIESRLAEIIPGEQRIAERLAGSAVGQRTARLSPASVRNRAEAIYKNLGYHDAFTFAKEMQEADDSYFRNYDPREESEHPDIYKRAFRDNFRALWANSPANKGWAQAMRSGGDTAAVQYLRDYATGLVDGTDNVGVRHIIKQKGVGVEQWAAQHHDWLKTITKDPELLRWAAKGEIGKTFDRHFKQHQALYPIVAAPRQNVFSHNFLVNAMKNGPQQVFRAVAEPMIHVSRAEGAWRLKLMYERHLEQTHPEWVGKGEAIASLASDQAIHWMEDNLYNGQRTLLGRSLRHVFPFDGATTNMARFYMRQVRQHPWLAEPLTRFANYEEQQAANNQDTSLLVNNNILTALGFSGSDALTGNLSHAFFLSADGLASFIPGVGPMFTPLLSYVANDQNLRDMFSGIPGLREQLQFAAGRSTGANPVQSAIGDVLPSWFSNQVDAVGLMSPLHSPLLSGLTGSTEDFNRRYDAKAKQLYADYLGGKRGAPPTPDEVRASVGADLLGAGVVGDVLPITPSMVDERNKLATNFLNQFQAATTPAQQKAVLAAAKQAGKDTGFDVTPLLLYHDPRTTLDEQDRLMNDNQWIVPYTTSMYESAGPKPSTLSEYDTKLASGDLHSLGVQEFTTQVSNKVQDAYLWVKYQQIKNAQATFLQANGVTTSDPTYKAYLASTINPAIQQLEDQGKVSGWTDKFLKSTSSTIPGLTANTVPLRTVATMDVLPITQDLVNGRSIAWQQALVNMQEASSTLASIRAEGGTKADEQTVIDGLNTQLQGIAAKSPDFAHELQYYTFSKFEDIVNLETQMAASGYGTG